MFTFTLLLAFTSAALLAYFGAPFIIRTAIQYNQSRAKKFAVEMDRTMMLDDIKKVQMAYVVGPFVVAGLCFMFAPEEYRWGGVLVGLVVGFIVPRTFANMLISKRRQQFNDQLVDALLIMASSFRGGLSLVQSMEAVLDEMPDPIRQEFGIVLGENKIGVTMDEALNRLQRRMPSPSLQQVITAILLARETGGNLPVIFSRIVHTIREKRKLEENINVLTIQGKLQAFVMSGLPVAFFVMVNSTNPKYFHVMTGTPVGQKLLAVCIVLWLVGTFFILKISSFKDF